MKIANILGIGNVSWMRSEAKRSGGHLSVAGGRSRTWCTKVPKGGFVCKCKPAAAHFVGGVSSLLRGWGGEGEWPWLLEDGSCIRPLWY